jgi:hypothetical protein
MSVHVERITLDKATPARRPRPPPGRLRSLATGSGCLLRPAAALALVLRGGGEDHRQRLLGAGRTCPPARFAVIRLTTPRASGSCARYVWTVQASGVNEAGDRTNNRPSDPSGARPQRRYVRELDSCRSASDRRTCRIWRLIRLVRWPLATERLNSSPLGVRVRAIRAYWSSDTLPRSAILVGRWIRPPVGRTARPRPWRCDLGVDACRKESACT